MIEIKQFFQSGIIYMAEFNINNKISNGVVISQLDKYYVTTGSDFYKNLEKHYLNEDQINKFKEFVIDTNR